MGQAQLARKAEAYFAGCQAAERQPTLTGLALALGLEGRRELERRAAGKGPAGAVLRLACSRVEEANLQAVYRRDTATGAKFILQADFGYGEKSPPAGQEDVTITVLLTEDG